MRQCRDNGRRHAFLHDHQHLNSDTFVVNKNFADNSSASVTVSVTCTNGGTPAPASGTVSQAAPRTYTITGFNSDATCTASETVPAGYTTHQTDCACVVIINGGSVICTITNTLNSSALTVNKIFSDNSAASVTVSVSCINGGTPAPASGTVSHPRHLRQRHAQRAVAA
jgi:hypothetical protein